MFCINKAKSPERIIVNIYTCVPIDIVLGSASLKTCYLKKQLSPPGQDQVLLPYQETTSILCQDSIVTVPMYMLAL